MTARVNSLPAIEISYLNVYSFMTVSPLLLQGGINEGILYWRP
jgi:hypothetical protein